MDKEQQIKEVSETYEDIKEGLEIGTERFLKNMKNVLEIEKKQAVKEFAEKLKKCSYCDNDFMDGKWHRYVFVDEIDKLLKEYEQ
jgi:hypothetical protein|nr:MAG TPA: hypothetical protein [Caudoviricetes sp.]